MTICPRFLVACIEYLPQKKVVIIDARERSQAVPLEVFSSFKSGTIDLQTGSDMTTGVIALNDEKTLVLAT